MYTVEIRFSGASPSFIKGVRSPRWHGEAEGARPCGGLARGLSLVVVRIHDGAELRNASSQPRLELGTAHLPPSVVGHVLKEQLHLVRSGLGLKVSSGGSCTAALCAHASACTPVR